MSNPSAGPANRLAHEKSAYLRQHAHNPVDWYPWGSEALERAKREDRPILLSVGYSACHWCHVMAHESFEDAATAQRMNDLFVNIKVDREERPDVDQLYQGVVALMGRGGGWPLTVFLTPDLKPFFGGTYFPPEDRYGLMGFPRLLEALNDAWRNRRADVNAQADEFLGGLQKLSTHALVSAPLDVGADQVVAAARLLAQDLDRTHGGFGGRPKFPNPMNVQLLLRAHRRAPDPELLGGAMLTLEKMAQGGIYDQLGGGFHRYSVDERWRVPHFEKMLYDNGQLLHLYSEAFQVEPRPLFQRVVEETVEYVRREMTSPEGPFYASQDADSEGEEGKFFVWTPEEVDAALPSELAELARLRWNVQPGGNFEDSGATVLEAKADLAELSQKLGISEADVETQLSRARELLFAARERRIKPGRDEKLLVSWNGLMIRGLALAARVFGRPEWAQLGGRAADFLIDNLWNGARLLRLYQQGPSRIEGFAEDYGHLAAGLVALYQATFEPRYLAIAEALVRRADELFWDEEVQAFLAAPRGQSELVTAQYALHDSASPSGASSLVEAQVALAALTGKPELMSTAATYLKKLSEPMQRNPFAFGHLWLAADAYVDGAAELTIVGEASAAAELLQTANATYAPTVALAFHDPANPAPPPLVETLRDRLPVAGKPAAYLCRRFSCAAPVTDATALQDALTNVR